MTQLRGLIHLPTDQGKIRPDSFAIDATNDLTRIVICGQPAARLVEGETQPVEFPGSGIAGVPHSILTEVVDVSTTDDGSEAKATLEKRNRLDTVTDGN